MSDEFKLEAQDIKDGEYIYRDKPGKPRGIYFKVKGKDTEYFIAPYVPRERKEEEKRTDYIERIREDAEQVIKMIEANKEAVEEDARNYAISSNQEIADTLLTFGSATWNTIKYIFSKSTAEIEKEISLTNIILGGVGAGYAEVKSPLIKKDIDNLLNMGDFFAKYGPAINTAIFRFGKNYGQITNRHLIYMKYIIKRENVLNATVAEIMEGLMIRGLYRIAQAIGVEKIKEFIQHLGIRRWFSNKITKEIEKDEKNFLEKIEGKAGGAKDKIVDVEYKIKNGIKKKIIKKVGKETVEELYVCNFVSGICLILAAGAIADTIKGALEEVFEPVNKELEQALQLDEYSREGVSYTENLMEMYQNYSSEIEEGIKKGLERIKGSKDIEINLDEIMEKSSGIAIKGVRLVAQNFISRYELFSKINGANKGYSVYQAMIQDKNNQDKLVKLVREENIDGPGFNYGFKISMTEYVSFMGAGVLTNTFDKFVEKGTGSTLINKATKENPLLTTGATKFTQGAAQSFVVNEMLKSLRQSIIFDEKQHTEFKGTTRFLGYIDDMEDYIYYSMGKDQLIKDAPDFLAYIDEKNIDEYIKDLEKKKNNNTSLDGPKELTWSLISYKGEKEGKEGEIEKRKVRLQFYNYPKEYDIDTYRIQLVELLKEKFEIIYKETEDIKVNWYASIPLELDLVGLADWSEYKVEKTTLDEIAKKKGLIDIESKRGRLNKNQEYMEGMGLSTEDIIEYNKKMKSKHNSSFIGAIGPEGDYVLLFNKYQQLAGGSVYAFGGRQSVGDPDEITDVQFPNEVYAVNDDLLLGSSNGQSSDTSKDNDVFEYWTCMNSSTYNKENKGRGTITINGERIGTALKRRQDLEGGYEHLTSKQEYEEIIKLADDKELEVRYTYDLNGSLVEDTYLVIKYRCKDYSEDGWNNLKIKEFKDLDYGIDIPDKGESLAGSNANKVKKKESEFKFVELEGSTGKETYSKIILKNQGNYFIPAGITPIEDSGVQEKSDLREEYTMESGDTLSRIAQNKLGKASLWVEIEREDGTTFSEEEAKHLRIGSKVYLPKK
jgi:hypothetical protein